MPRYVKPDRSAAIGARICIARVTAGLSRPELGRDLDLSAAQIEKYERGFARLPAVMLLDLGRLLNVTPSFFLATDDGAVARALILQVPAAKVMRRQLDRALVTLKAFATEPGLGAAPLSPIEQRISA